MPFGLNPVEDIVGDTGVPEVRLTDPVTGGGLFTTNTDPNVTGIDSLTGTDAPDGTDVGFGAAMRAFIATGMYNGDFRLPPADTTKPINGDTSSIDYNPLPYWTCADSNGGHITATWVNDSSGGSVTFAQTAGGPVSAYVQLEALVPVSPLTGASVVKIASAPFGAFSGSGGVLYLSGQYLQDDAVTTTGTSHEVTWDSLSGEYLASYFSAVANAGTGAPADAAYLRLRLGFRTGTATADSVTVDYAYVRTGVVSNVASTGLGSNQDDWAPAGLESCDVLLVAPSGATRTITGLDSTYAYSGRRLYIANSSGTIDLVLSHDDGASTVPNRIYLPNLANLTLRPYGAVTLIYSGDDQTAAAAHKRWRGMSER